MGGAVWKGNSSVTSTNNVNSVVDFQLLQNHPNPFSNSTKIQFNLVTSQVVHIKIYNSKGVLVKTIENNFNEGWNEIEINKNELLGAGIYFYDLQSSKDRKMGKMIAL